MCNHARYRRIPVQVCDKGCPHGRGKDLEIVLFKNNKKLRSHAVKHFLNLTEDWKNNNLSLYISALEDMGCQFLEPGTALKDPPCDTCSNYAQCTPKVGPLEISYTNAVEDIIKEGCKLPRYACFLSDEWGTDLLSVVPNRKFVAKAALLPNGAYNLMTCYDKTGFSMNRVIEMQRQKIRNEASRGTIVWCDQTNWGIRSSASPKSEVRKKHKKRKPGKMRKPYSRGGARNFKEYFDEDGDW